MNPTSADRVRELLRRMDKVTDPVPLGNGSLRPFLQDEASMSGLNANLRTLYQATQLAYCIACNPAPAAQIICDAGLDATEADDLRETLALGHEIAEDVAALLARVNQLFGKDSKSAARKRSSRLSR